MTTVKIMTDDGPAPVTDEQRAILAEMIGNRNCDGCSLCCKLPKIDLPELVKPVAQWCKHCDTGRSRCAIYDRRPSVCASFHCGWLLWANFVPDYWKPSHSRMLLHMADDMPALKIVVDKIARGRWREQPWIGDIYVMRGAVRNFGVDLWIEEVGRPGLWFVDEFDIVFIPANFKFVQIKHEGRAIYCPMPPEACADFEADKHDRVKRWAIWNKHFNQRTTVKITGAK